MSLTADIREVDLSHYYPSTVAPSKEFQALAEVENTELDTLWVELWQQMFNTFVYDLNEQGASRWESMLSIYPTSDETLEDRRQAILKKINSTAPYTERSFQNMVNGIYGDDMVTVNVDYLNYQISFDLNPSMIQYYSSLYRFTRVIVPANLAITAKASKAVTCNIFVGSKEMQVGRKRIGLQKPIYSDTNIRYGSADYLFGKVTLGLSKPIKAVKPIFIANYAMKTGSITINCRGENI